MRKLSTLSLAFILTLPWLAGCNHGDQGPSSEQTKTPLITPPAPTYRDQPGQYFTQPGSSEPTPIANISGNSESPGLRQVTLSKDIDWDHPTPDMLLATVHFDFDQFNIEAKDRPLLEAAAKAMAADPSMRVVAVGHTDHYGSEQYNLALGDRRSNSVKGYLANNGAGAAQAEILSRGKFGAVPDVKKNSPEAVNDRRVDVIKVPAGATLPSGPPPPATTPVMTAAP